MSVDFITRHGKRQQQNRYALQQGSPKLLAKWHLTKISWANNNIMRCHVSVYTCRLVLQCLVKIWYAIPIIFTEVLSFSGEKLDGISTGLETLHSESFQTLLLRISSTISHYEIRYKGSVDRWRVNKGRLLSGRIRYLFWGRKGRLLEILFTCRNTNVMSAFPPFYV